MPSVKSSKPIDAKFEITKLAFTEGVTVVFDWDESTQDSQSGAKYTFEPKGRILTLNICLLQEEEKPFLLDLIRKIHEVNEGYIWKANKSEILEKFETFKEENKYKQILDLYQKIIPTDDFSALKMSYFLKDYHLTNEPLGYLKNDIRLKFGERGANIANLCTAGYFENEFKQYYEKVSNVNTFLEYYESAVSLKERALFVHSKMSIDEIRKEVERMVEKSITYGMYGFRIHGKGKYNIAAITEFVDSVTQEDNFTVDIAKSDTLLEVVEYLVNPKRK